MNATERIQLVRASYAQGRTLSCASKHDGQRCSPRARAENRGGDAGWETQVLALFARLAGKTWSFGQFNIELRFLWATAPASRKRSQYSIQRLQLAEGVE